MTVVFMCGAKGDGVRFTVWVAGVWGVLLCVDCLTISDLWREYWLPSYP